jgi:monooxygenase
VSTAESTNDGPGYGPTPEHVDVLIVGAGLSGIGAACHLRTEAPGLSYAIVESRGTSGGTWDLFRYPGIRSDSDMFTLAYPFRPWLGEKAIAEGADILAYIRETAVEYDVARHIEYRTRVVGASWSSETAGWTVTTESTDSGARTTRTCGFLYLCAGYYRYDEGYTPSWPGQQDFAGRLIHPQSWPDDLDVNGKRIVVIGSGATAVTLVPALTEAGAHVTMLQRSPSFVMSLPAQDPVAGVLRRVLPERRAYSAIRWKNVKIATAVYSLCQRYPARARSILIRGVAKQLPAGYDVNLHFNPRYQPWDQRMCLVPGGDFFKAIRSGSAEVVTDEISSFTHDGLLLTSGTELRADIVVSATGLNLLTLGGIELTVDGTPVAVQERVAFKAMMLDGIPNMAFAIGYTNAAWTLKVDLVSSYIARLLKSMRDKGYTSVTPTLPAEAMKTSPFIDMRSGYFRRALETMPRQGDRAPWRLRQHYARDAALFRTPIDDAELEFRATGVTAATR